MSDLNEAMIKGSRHEFKAGMNALLECDGLWNDKLSHAILEDAIDQANGHRDVVIERSESFGPQLVEQYYRQLLRDVIAIGKVSQLLSAWARSS
jgi:serine/threonine protein phosphatase PrpC